MNFDLIPEEILEKILENVSMYQDLDTCRLVCRKWYHAVKNIIRRKRNKLRSAIQSNSLRWEHQSKIDNTINIQNRCNHSVCYSDGFMYVFGGISTQNTCFNDLVILNLTTRKWSKPQTKGSYPLPKSSALMCYYNGKLILHGGIARPHFTQIFAEPTVFDDLHVYDINNQEWTVVDQKPYKLKNAFHTGTIHKDVMVVVAVSNLNLYRSGSNLYCLNLKTMEWSQPHIVGHEPCYLDKSQIYIDEEHFLIVGGFVKTSPNSEMRLFTMPDQYPWFWQKIEVEYSNFTPSFCNFPQKCPITRVDDVLVGFSCARKTAYPPRDRHIPRPRRERMVIQEAHNPLQRYDAARNPPNRELPFQLLAFQEVGIIVPLWPDLPAGFEEERRNQRERALLENSHSLHMHVCDISNLLNNCVVTWQEPKKCKRALRPKTGGSLILGRGELITFGGFTLCEDDDPSQDESPYLEYAVPHF